MTEVSADSTILFGFYAIYFLYPGQQKVPGNPETFAAIRKY